MGLGREHREARDSWDWARQVEPAARSSSTTACGRRSVPAAAQWVHSLASGAEVLSGAPLSSASILTHLLIGRSDAFAGIVLTLNRSRDLNHIFPVV